MDAASDSAMGVGLDATSRDATVHPRDAGKDATLDVEPGSDATSADASTLEDASTSDDGSTDVLSTPDTQVEAESDVTVVSDAGEAGTQDSGVQGDAGAPDATIDATTADGALSDVNAPTDAADGGVVTDAQNVDSGVPSCLVPGTYTIPVTGTNCNVDEESCEQETTPTSYDLALTIVDDPVAGWGITFAGNSSLPFPPMTPVGMPDALPIVFTATGFAANGSVPLVAVYMETISLSVDCLTGIATFSSEFTFYPTAGECPVNSLCAFFSLTYDTLSGTCSNCL
jgi:hypothetical protein